MQVNNLTIEQARTIIRLINETGADPANQDNAIIIDSLNRAMREEFEVNVHRATVDFEFDVMRRTIGEDIMQEVISYLVMGNWIQATRIVRSAAGTGVFTARDFISRIDPTVRQR